MTEFHFMSCVECDGTIIGTMQIPQGKVICDICFKQKQRTKLQVVWDAIYGVYAKVYNKAEKIYWNLYLQVDDKYRWYFHRILGRWPGMKKGGDF